MDYTYLYDNQFLTEFDKEVKKVQYIRIEALDFTKESVLATIEGKATAGSCTFSGTSNMRRVANCTLLVDKEGIRQAGYSDYQQYYNILNVSSLISVNKKIRLYTGFKNTLAYKYPQYSQYNIIWFPLGTYVIKTANTSKNNSGINISLTLNDKCALLNGDLGGVFPAGATLSELEEYSITADGTVQREVKKLLIKDIIRYIVVEFGGEDPGNILIADVPDSIIKVMKWTGSEPLYYLEDQTSGSKFFLETNQITGLEVKGSYEYGQDVCYVNEPFVYPGKLECNAGETVASVLDKIKNTLGNYEWFYDINGRFVFQEIKNYLNTSLSKTLLELSPSDYSVIPNLSSSVFTFGKEEKNLISSISNNPQYQNIKNDFIVWGNVKTGTGVDKPIRYHLVLGEKPQISLDKYEAIVYKDARGLWAIISVNNNDKVVKLSGNQNLNVEKDDKSKYYIVNNKVCRYSKEANNFITDENYEYCYLKVRDWRTQLYFNGIFESSTFAKNPYAAELASEWPKIYDIKKTCETNSAVVKTYIGDYKDTKNTSGYEYWIDIIENNEFSVNSIGRRQKIVSGNNVNCLFSPTVPNFVLLAADGDTEEERKLAEEKGQEVIQVSEKVYNNLSLGGGYNSAFDKIKELLYLHTSYNESISLTTIPIYHLEPNTRITVHDEELGIGGDYVIKSISLPLAYNGTSTISATKIVEKTF